MNYQKAVCWAAVLAFPISSPALSQQINLGTPFHTTSDSFHERMGVNFGFSIAGGQGSGSRVVGLGPGGFLTPNINFTQNSAGSTIPAFGGFDPNSGARFGFSSRSPGGGGFSLGFDLSQGNTRTLSSTTPSITILNGGIGVIGSGAAVPFVTGVTPIVGYTQVPDNAVTRAINSGQLRPYAPQERSRDADESNGRTGNPVSSATSGDISVSDIKAQQAAQELHRQHEFETAIIAATTAVEMGDYRTARINLRMAIKLEKDPTEQRRLRDWLKTLSGK